MPWLSYGVREVWAPTIDGTSFLFVLSYRAAAYWRDPHSEGSEWSGERGAVEDMTCCVRDVA